MTIVWDLLERPGDEAARRIALEALANLSAAEKRLKSGRDEEALHDFRVATRRLRSTLELHRGFYKNVIRSSDIRALKAIQRATNADRDTEVALQWIETLAEPTRDAAVIAQLQAECRGLRRRQKRRLAKQSRKIRRCLDRRLARFAVDLRTPSPSYRVAIQPVITKCFDTLVASLRQGAKNLKAGRLHSARIEVKRFRYLIEPLRDFTETAAPTVQVLKMFQDLLGQINDAFVLDGTLTSWLQSGFDAPLEDLLAANQERLQDLKTGFRALLAEQEENLKASLRELQEEVGDESIEIERKYLLKSLPKLPEGATFQDLEQGYLPGRKLRDRVRKIVSNGTTRYVRTLKSGTGVRRLEIEEDTTQEVFDALWSATQGARIQKRRYIVPEGDRRWEIDVFADRELFLAEIELDSEAERVDVPAWLADVMDREVTSDGRFTNLALAR